MWDWIGLDPARPFFEWMPAFVRLDATDAQFVDVIHTNGGVAGISDRDRDHFATTHNCVRMFQFQVYCTIIYST